MWGGVVGEIKDSGFMYNGWLEKLVFYGRGVGVVGGGRFLRFSGFSLFLVLDGVFRVVYVICSMYLYYLLRREFLVFCRVGFILILELG